MTSFFQLLHVHEQLLAVSPVGDIYKQIGDRPTVVCRNHVSTYACTVMNTIFDIKQRREF